MLSPLQVSDANQVLVIIIVPVILAVTVVVLALLSRWILDRTRRDRIEERERVIEELGSERR